MVVLLASLSLSLSLTLSLTLSLSLSLTLSRRVFVREKSVHSNCSPHMRVRMRVRTFMAHAMLKEYETDPDASRLGCQLILTEDLVGMKIQLPGTTTNYMDHIPFE